MCPLRVYVIGQSPLHPDRQVSKQVAAVDWLATNDHPTWDLLPGSENIALTLLDLPGEVNTFEVVVHLISTPVCLL